MNKDLDDRILPAGEYRDAQNIVIATSEGSDVGTVQTILGNTEIADYINTDAIHALTDNINNCVYVWATNAPLTTKSALWKIHNTHSGFTATKLLEGSWLKFNAYATFQANLLENYLYWVDGVNPPRVIDVDLAYESAITNTPYYTNEDHISVAKYNPYKIMRSIRRIETTFDSASTNIITVADATGIIAGDYVVNWSNYQFLGIVESISGSDLTLDRTPPASTASDELYIYQSTQTDKSDKTQYPDWPGDPDFLEDKFVRFSYRYKFDDDTYSLIAPYTQPIYKPKQGGYFGEENNITDEEKTLNSTIVKFMENSVNNVEFFVPLPTNQPAVDYKIKEVEIIFTESDKLSAQIVETIPIEKIIIEEDYALDGAYFKYEYRSTIPYKTVTQQDYIRVSDQIPIRARSQAIASNRVMYGNFDTKLDAPEEINFSVGADEKNGKSEIHAEYQNHTVKQNRNYQVGIVLKDKYGRSSGVISSSYLNEITTAVSQSTDYHAYKEENWSPGVKDWLGDSLKVNMIDKIPNVNLYAEESNSFNITSNPTFSADGKSITFDTGSSPATITIGTYLRGRYKDYVEITSIGGGFNGSTWTSTIVCDGEISTEVYSYKPFLQNEQVLHTYTIDSKGWYTYTVVLKQLEQDYYNVYLPDLLNGTLFYDTVNNTWTDTDENQAVTLSLYSDNINKVPRDLEEVGPDQEQYRSSSILLSGRVTNTAAGNEQYYPGRITHEINRIGTLKELFANTEDDTTYAGGPDGINNSASNPLIAIGEVSNNSIGVTLTQASGKTTLDLAVYETEPVKSRIEIYYETSTTGLISDINNLVENSFTGPARTTDITASLAEDQDLSTPFTISNQFQVENIQGADITPSDYGITNVVDQEGTIVEGNLFSLSLNAQNFSILANEDAEFEYTLQSPLVNTYTVNMFFEHNGQILETSALVTPENARPNRSLWVPNNAEGDVAVPQTIQIDTDTGAGDGNFTDTVFVGSDRVFSVRLHNGSVKYDGPNSTILPGTDVILEADNFQVAGNDWRLSLPDELDWATRITSGTTQVVEEPEEVTYTQITNADKVSGDNVFNSDYPYSLYWPTTQQIFGNIYDIGRIKNVDVTIENIVGLNSGETFKITFANDNSSGGGEGVIWHEKEITYLGVGDITFSWGVEDFTSVRYARYLKVKFESVFQFDCTLTMNIKNQRRTQPDNFGYGSVNDVYVQGIYSKAFSISGGVQAPTTTETISNPIQVIGPGFLIKSRDINVNEPRPKENDIRRIVYAEFSNTSSLNSPSFFHQLREAQKYNTNTDITNRISEAFVPSSATLRTKEMVVWKSLDFEWGAEQTKRFSFGSDFSGFSAADEGKSFNVKYVVEYWEGVELIDIDRDEVDSEYTRIEVEWVQDPKRTVVFEGTVTVRERDKNGTITYEGDFGTHNPINFNVQYDTTSSNDYTTAYLQPTSDTEFDVSDYTYSLDWRIKDVNGETSESETVSGTYTFTALEDPNAGTTPENTPNINLYFPGFDDPNPPSPTAILLEKGSTEDFSDPLNRNYSFNATNSVGDDVTNKVVVTGYPNSRYEAGVAGAIPGDDRWYPNASGQSYTVYYDLPSTFDPNGLTAQQRTRSVIVQESTTEPEYASLDRVVVDEDSQGAFLDGICEASYKAGRIDQMQFWYKFPGISLYDNYTRLTNSSVLLNFDNPEGTFGGLHVADVNKWRPESVVKNWRKVQVKLIAISEDGGTIEVEKLFLRYLR